MAFPAPPVVSLQRPGAGTALDRHVSWAVLVAPDIVLAPAPEKELVDLSQRFEVLITSAPRRAQVVAERIVVQHVQVLRPKAAAGGLAILTLRTASRHFPFVSDADPRDAGPLLDQGLTFWAALEKIGAVPPGTLEQPLGLLRGAVKVEQAEVDASLRVDEPAAGETEALKLCCVIWWRTCCSQVDDVPVLLGAPTLRRPGPAAQS